MLHCFPPPPCTRRLHFLPTSHIRSFLAWFVVFMALALSSMHGQGIDRRHLFARWRSQHRRERRITVTLVRTHRCCHGFCEAIGLDGASRARAGRANISCTARRTRARYLHQRADIAPLTVSLFLLLARPFISARLLHAAGLFLPSPLGYHHTTLRARCCFSPVE